MAVKVRLAGAIGVASANRSRGRCTNFRQLRRRGNIGWTCRRDYCFADGGQGHVGRRNRRRVWNRSRRAQQLPSAPASHCNISRTRRSNHRRADGGQCQIGRRNRRRFWNRSRCCTNFRRLRRRSNIGWTCRRTCRFADGGQFQIGQRNRRRFLNRSRCRCDIGRLSCFCNFRRTCRRNCRRADGGQCQIGRGNRRRFSNRSRVSHDFRRRPASRASSVGLAEAITVARIAVKVMLASAIGVASAIDSRGRCNSRRLSVFLQLPSDSPPQLSSRGWRSMGHVGRRNRRRFWNRSRER